MTIPTDNVDPVYIQSPQKWNVRIIRNFMIAIGPISSIFDFLTFYILVAVFRSSEAFFHTGWFVESLATQTLVLFVIRTAGRPWSNRPSLPLASTTDSDRDRRLGAALLAASETSWVCTIAGPFFSLSRGSSHQLPDSRRVSESAAGTIITAADLAEDLRMKGAKLAHRLMPLRQQPAG